MDERAINVHVTDYVENDLFDNQDAFSIIEAIYLLQSKIEDRIGGMLCTEHITLPESKTGYEHNEWIIRIRCCCTIQTHAVRDRLDELFASEQ